METIDNNDNEYITRHEPSGSRSISVVALVVGVGIAAVLFWMSLSLSSHVSKLEESIVSLQRPMGGEGSKELADVSKQLGKLTQALNDHLNSQPANMEMAVGSPAMASPSKNNISPQASPSLAANLPIQAAPADAAPPPPCPSATPSACFSRAMSRIEQAPALAAEMLHIACDESHAAACSNLGQLYEAGSGVARDHQQAAALYDKACTAKEASQLFQLLEWLRPAKAAPTRHNHHSIFQAYALLLLLHSPQKFGSRRLDV